jgi:hypothetical protein
MSYPKRDLITKKLLGMKENMNDLSIELITYWAKDIKVSVVFSETIPSLL